MPTISIASIKNFPGARRDFAIGEGLPPLETATAGITIIAPLTITGSLENQGAGRILLKGKVAARVEMPCGRCNERFQTDYAFPIEGEYIPAADWQDDLEGEAARYPYRGEQIELLPPLEEALFLELPMQPLCREDCAGLCKQCGINLNHHSCSCEEDTIDPRWQKLKDLIVEAKEKGV